MNAEPRRTTTSLSLGVQATVGLGGSAATIHVTRSESIGGLRCVPLDVIVGIQRGVHPSRSPSRWRGGGQGCGGAGGALRLAGIGNRLAVSPTPVLHGGDKAWLILEVDGDGGTSSCLH